ncbi:MFS transporter [Blastococcus mobilis]|uniref:Predicted arabinose efflux permease, MFS family n=1 Tax=Blastococcus mobilis TaxID=1938746 RepID=A0A238WK35_9ACTN|nr:MFS transporter [Blastococcus mobilis]SNR46932.1 Predicted arabinose efflux permease, MFS family [Blastococcus mobilis]
MGWAALSELVPYYPLYALLFLDTGLSTVAISILFAVWSITGFITEIPAGALADRWSRRGVVVLAGVLQAAGFVVWTAAPAFGAFAIGFVLWGVGGALVSGASEALVHDALADVEAADSFGRVHGWMTAAELLVQVPTAFAASALFALGGYRLVGWVSVGVCLLAALLALRFPEPARVPDGETSLAGTLRQGVREAVRTPALRLTVLAVALIGALDAVEEYFPVLAAAQGVPVTGVPFAVLAVALAGALGAALGGRAARLPDRALPVLLGTAGLCLAAVVLPVLAGLVALCVFYALYLAVLVAAEARLQDRIDSPHRATITSVAGLGIELGSLLVFAAWAVGGATAVAVLVLAVVPVVRSGLRVSVPAELAADRPTE